MFVKNTWYVAAFAGEIGASGHLARTIANTPILMYRQSNGKIAALLDRCPHRFAPLSAGKVIGDNVQCGYHGLVFGASGKCVKNPYGPTLEALTIASYPVEEKNGLIWVWLGDVAKADPNHMPDMSFVDRAPETARSTGYIPVKANFQLLVDNIMDLTHADYLHPDTLAGVTPAKPTVREPGDGSAWVEWSSDNVQAMPVHRPYLDSPDQLITSWLSVHWFPSGAMHMAAGAYPPGKTKEEGLKSYTAHIMTPETQNTTHYFYTVWRNWDQDNAEYNKFFSEAVHDAFANQDAPMIEAQQTRIGANNLDDMRPVLLAHDTATTRIRRLFKKLLDEENGGSPQRSAAE